MRKGIFLAGMFALLICSVLKSNGEEITNETPDFSRYPQSPQLPFGENVLSGVINSHTHDNFLNDNRNALVQIFSFQLVPEAGGQNSWSIKKNGREWEARVEPDAVQNSFQRQLTPTEVADLRAAIKALPAENTYPDIGHLTVVSFREGEKWITRCYDQANAPGGLKKIHEIIDKSHMLTQAEEDAEAETATKQKVVAARAPSQESPPDLKIEDAVPKSAAIFVGTLNYLDGPRDAQLGEARYYGGVDISQVLNGTVGPPRNWVAIDAKLIPLYHEEESNIFFAVPTDYASPRTTVGTRFTIIKFLPATDDNIAKVKGLISAKPVSK